MTVAIVSTGHNCSPCRERTEPQLVAAGAFARLPRAKLDVDPFFGAFDVVDVIGQRQDKVKQRFTILLMSGLRLPRPLFIMLEEAMSG